MKLTDDRADVPLRPAAGRAGTGSSGSSTSRPSATRARRSMPRSSSSAARFYRDAGLTGVEVLLNSIGDPACRPAYVEELTAYYRRPRATRCRRSSATASSATSCACSTRRTRRWPRSTPRRRRSPTGCATPCAEHFAGRPGPPRRARRRRTGSSRASFAGSTTTRGRRSSSTSPGARASSQALGGGGRYDGLVELLGGRPTPGIGFGIGLDRVVLALAETRARGAAGRAAARSRSSSAPTRPTTAARLRVATDLRAAGIAARADLGAAQARQAARGGRPRPRPLRGHRRRRARRRRGPAARPAGRHAEAGGARRPRPRDRASARPPTATEPRRLTCPADRWASGAATRPTSAAGAGWSPPRFLDWLALGAGSRLGRRRLRDRRATGAVLARGRAGVGGRGGSLPGLLEHAAAAAETAGGFASDAAGALPLRDGGADVVVSGLVLNFLPGSGARPRRDAPVAAPGRRGRRLRLGLRRAAWS